MKRLELIEELEIARSEYWDCQDALAKVALRKAGILNQLKELGDE